MRKQKNKGFTINVLINYDETVNISNYREPLHAIFLNLSWLHGLDYSIDSNTLTFDKVRTEINTTIDVVYLRSGINTNLTLKEIKEIIDLMVFKSIANIFSGVAIFYQTQVGSKGYPFPNEFYRPLNYPYVEFHKGYEKELLVYKDALGLELSLILNPN